MNLLPRQLFLPAKPTRREVQNYKGSTDSFASNCHRRGELDPDEELELLKSYAQVARDLAARGRMTESYETLQQIRRRWPDLGGLLGFRRGQP